MHTPPGQLGERKRRATPNQEDATRDIAIQPSVITSDPLDEASPDEEHPLVAALTQHMGHQGVRDDGRLFISLAPEALDAICAVLDRRRRHMSVPQEAIDELNLYRRYVCNAPLRRHSQGACLYFTDGPNQRCARHLAIHRIHPLARPAIDQLGTRAKGLFTLLTERHSWARDAWNIERLASRLEISASTAHRTIAELAEVHLAWKPGRRQGLTVHPAVAFYEAASEHQKALAMLRADRRAVWAHLEPEPEDEKAAA